MADLTAVESGGQEIEAGQHPVAGGEALGSQAVPAGREDGVAHAHGSGAEVTGGGDIGQYQQRAGDHDRMRGEAVEEPGPVDQAGGGERGGQVQRQAVVGESRAVREGAHAGKCIERHRRGPLIEIGSLPRRDRSGSASRSVHESGQALGFRDTAAPSGAGPVRRTDFEPEYDRSRRKEAAPHSRPGLCPVGAWGPHRVGAGGSEPAKESRYGGAARICSDAHGLYSTWTCRCQGATMVRGRHDVAGGRLIPSRSQGDRSRTMRARTER